MLNSKLFTKSCLTTSVCVWYKRRTELISLVLARNRISLVRFHIYSTVVDQSTLGQYT